MSWLHLFSLYACLHALLVGLSEINSFDNRNCLITFLIIYSLLSGILSALQIACKFQLLCNHFLGRWLHDSFNFQVHLGVWAEYQWSLAHNLVLYMIHNCHIWFFSYVLFVDFLVLLLFSCDGGKRVAGVSNLRSSSI